MGKLTCLPKCRLNLFRVNVFTGPPEERIMTTGLHVVRDILCSDCQITLGWKYVNDLT